ncbi:hypothetical protein AB3S75_012741 [Citrus x aurantiifolia]
MAAEVGLAAFSSIVSEGAKTLFEPIMRQISYVFNYQSYIDGLKDQVKQLGYKREMVQQPVNHARLQEMSFMRVSQTGYIALMNSSVKELQNPSLMMKIELRNPASKDCTQI